MSIHDAQTVLQRIRRAVLSEEPEFVIPVDLSGSDDIDIIFEPFDERTIYVSAAVLRDLSEEEYEVLFEQVTGRNYKSIKGRRGRKK